MIGNLKKLLYFPIAYYFRFWAQIQLFLWKPRILAITGSSGKTTLLHLIKSQLGNKAKYSHHANSSYGIPFDILGLGRKDLTPNEWINLFLLAPFRAFKNVPKEKFYVVEADCDRPGEGKFLASLLRPEITLWINSSITHSVNFDYLVKNKSNTFFLRGIEPTQKKKPPNPHSKLRGFKKVLDKCFSSVEEAIAYEFGYFLEYTKKLAIVNGDSSLIRKELKRTSVTVREVSMQDLNGYTILNNRTDFDTKDKKYSINFIVPKDVFYSIQIAKLLMKTLDLPFNPNFVDLTLPPGRNSVFKGVKNTTIIDSSYNATPDGVKSILGMFNQYPSDKKWLVLGDMIELGNEEKEEHEKLAKIINTMDLLKVVLTGPRVSKYTFSKLNLPAGRADNFIMPKDGLDYILNNIKGGETILFKGARFLEGIIEHLLENKNDIGRLCRREKTWQERRKKWGL